MTDAGARVGFVVIGRNEGRRLVACLDSLLQAGARTIVYVDSGSTDASVSEAQARGARIVELDMSRPFSAGRARNEGFEALVGFAPQLEFVQFVDGDCELESGWLGSALDFLDKRPDVAIVCGRRLERNPAASRYNRLCDMEWNTPVGEAQACGGDSLVRTDAFRQIGGFDARLIAGEEPEMCSRMRAAGWKIWRLDAAMTRHDAAIYRFSQWWMRAVRSGFGYAQVWSVTRETGNPLYAREMRRAILWAGIIPLIILAAALFDVRLGLLCLGVYALQLFRIVARLGVTRRGSWSYGLFAILAKFPEFQGIVQFLLTAARGRQRSAILYK